MGSDASRGKGTPDTVAATGPCTSSGCAARQPTPFGAVLRHYRLRAGLSQQELAERARLSVGGLSDLERGARTRPRSSTMRLLVAALDLAPNDREELMAAAPAGRAGRPRRLLDTTLTGGAWRGVSPRRRWR